MNGILNIHKPCDITSFQVVAKIKHVLHERHIGHAGTLDPRATGVLPICLGQATRIIEFLFDETKSYQAEIELGVTTDTYDSEGKVIRTADASGVSVEIIESALEKFKGSVLQTPPMFSAIKHRGKPLYELARSGIEIERKSRTVHIDSLEIVQWQPPVITLDVVCGKGTYIRSLAYDLGEALGCGANLKSLVRLRVGPFRIEDALTLLQFEEAYRQGQIDKYLHPIDSVLSKFESITVNHELQNSLVHGSPVTLFSHLAIASGTLRRAYAEDGRFLGMLKYNAETRLWHPEKIFLKEVH